MEEADSALAAGLAADPRHGMLRPSARGAVPRLTTISKRYTTSKCC
jgi:hypothetical protein